MGKGKSFNGKSKNRNKAISKIERRLIHTKKESAKQFNRKETARQNLKELKDQRVEGNGRLVVFKRNDPMAPCLLQNIIIGGKFIDHAWVKIPVEERKKLKFCNKNDRIHFTAEIHEYYKRYDREVEIKLGLEKLLLVKE